MLDEGRMPENIKELAYFDWDQLYAVEPKVGIYAWYFCPEEFNTDDLKSEDAVLDKIDEMAEKTQIPEIQTKLRGNLSLAFEGTLKHSFFRAKNLSEDSKGKKSRYSTIDQAIKTVPGRTALSRFLSEAAPLLAAPLYIGVAINLKSRLNSHKTDIENLEQADVEKFEADFSEWDRDKIFAHRVNKRDIDPNHLKVGVVYMHDILPEKEWNDLAFVGEDNPDKAQEKIQRAWVEAIETILNRLYHPILGKR